MQFRISSCCWYSFFFVFCMLLVLDHRWYELESGCLKGRPLCVGVIESGTINGLHDKHEWGLGNTLCWLAFILYTKQAICQVPNCKKRKYLYLYLTFDSFRKLFMIPLFTLRIDIWVILIFINFSWLRWFCWFSL